MVDSGALNIIYIKPCVGGVCSQVDTSAHQLGMSFVIRRLLNVFLITILRDIAKSYRPESDHCISR